MAGVASCTLGACAMEQSQVVGFAEWSDQNWEPQVSTFIDGRCPELTIEEVRRWVDCVFTPNAGLPNGLQDPKGDGYTEVYWPDIPMHPIPLDENTKLPIS